MITDAVLITIYIALATLIVAATLSFAVHKMHQRLSSTYYWISACIIGWLIVTFAYHFTTDPWLAEYLDNLTFPFIAFLPVLLLRFTFRFYNSGWRPPNAVKLLLCIIPMATTVISVVPAFNWLIRADYTMLQMYPLHIADYTWNVWFYIHAGYSYLLIVACIVLVIKQYKKQPREYRLPSVLMLAGIVVAYSSDLISFSTPDTIVDNTLVGVCVSMLVLYFAIASNPAVEVQNAARKALYNNMDLPVFIIDRQEYILDMNQAAHSMMKALGARDEDIRTMAFDDVASVISRFGGMARDGFSEDGLPNIFLSLNGESMVFKQTRRELFDKRGKLLGSYVAMMDITGLRRMVDELQRKAEVDVLTGLPNRRAFDQRVSELDTPEHLPISFIVGDVNHLKRVNDELGHKHGDLLLRTVANVLMAACPDDGMAARIGGDEFILVLPQRGEKEAQAVANIIHAELKNVEQPFMGASIALGCVTKTQMHEDAQKLIHEADQRMYSQKKYDRRGKGDARK